MSSNYSIYNMKMLVTQSCLTLCDHMDCSPPGSSVHGILQARILEWVANSSSRGSSWPRDWTHISCIEGRFFTIWSTREWASIPILRNSSCTLKAQQIDRLEFYLRWKHHAGRIARDTAPELEGWVPTMLLLAVRLTWGRKE